MISSNCSESSNQSLDPKEMFVYNLFAQSLLKPYLRQKQPYSFLKHKLSIFITHFFYKKQFFISNSRLNLAKNQANAKQHPEAELLLFENYSHSLFTLLCKNTSTYFMKKEKEQVCLYS